MHRHIHTYIKKYIHRYVDSRYIDTECYVSIHPLQYDCDLVEPRGRESSHHPVVEAEPKLGSHHALLHVTRWNRAGKP